MRFSAHISMLFTEAPFEMRPALARDAGFGAIEFWWPTGLCLDAVRDSVRASGIDVALINFDGGDLAAGERGLLSNPRTAEAFRAHVPSALAFADAIGCRRVNALVGCRDASLPESAQWQLAVENVGWAADRAAALAIEILIEAINPIDVPSYLLSDTQSAADLVAAVDRSNVKLLFDRYHAQRSGDDVIDAVHRHGRRIGHVQIADAPSRTQPGSGEGDVWSFLRALDADGYSGYVGLEYHPSPDTEAGLVWLPRKQRDGTVRLSDVADGMNGANR